jgi:hydroxyethylthiazole kinase-like uncharacterized protein yjeF
MRQAYRVENVRTAEAALMARLPEGTLMARAAAGLAVTCARLLRESGHAIYGARVALLVGSGDNGGDTLFAGASLARRGARVDALLLSPQKAHAAGLAALLAAGGRSHDVGQVDDALRAKLRHADLVLDGIVGIGGTGALRDPAGDLVAEARAGTAIIVAVDVPSGVDASTGEVAGAAVDADVTVTFGTYKPGLLVDPGAAFAGVVELIDIGLADLPQEPDVAVLSTGDVAELLPVPMRESDKYRRGVVGLVCGSARYPGAAALATGAALRSGAGAVRYSGPQRVADLVRLRWPEALVSEGLPAAAGRVQAWVVGSGIDTGDEARERLRDALAQDVPTLLDADALNLLAEAGPGLLRGRRAPIVITPHAGEAARLLGGERAAVERARLDAVRRLADEFGVTALLKGSTTVIAEPGRRAMRVNPTGTPALATAGSGDVLSGLVGGLLAAGLSAYDAASAGAWLHGLAGRRAAAPRRGRRGGPMVVGGEHPVTAEDLITALPGAWSVVAAARA